MPRKTFANGFPLPASDLNTYLMDQSVQTYADATARTAALPTPVEGQVSYLADQNTAYVYDGSSWNAVVDAKNYATVLPVQRNVVINGAFDNWQRGTSLVGGGYIADRFTWTGGAGSTQSRQTFTPGSAPVAGYEGQYYYNITLTSNNQNAELIQRVEDARTFAGQTVTLSFWARSTVGAQLANVNIYQHYGTGGSPSALTEAGLNATFTPTSSWVRYTFTATLNSVSGKTFGTNQDSFLWVRLAQMTATTSNTSLDIWGVQLEAGSVATPFVRFGGSPIADKYAGSRYCQALGAGAVGRANSSTLAEVFLNFPTRMRTSPTMTFGGAFTALEVNTAGRTITNAVLNASGSTGAWVGLTTTGLTSPNMVAIQSDNNLIFSAEL